MTQRVHSTVWMDTRRGQIRESWLTHFHQSKRGCSRVDLLFGEKIFFEEKLIDFLLNRWFSEYFFRDEHFKKFRQAFELKFRFFFFFEGELAWPSPTFGKIQKCFLHSYRSNRKQRYRKGLSREFSLRSLKQVIICRNLGINDFTSTTRISDLAPKSLNNCQDIFRLTSLREMASERALIFAPSFVIIFFPSTHPMGTVSSRYGICHSACMHALHTVRGTEQ